MAPQIIQDRKQRRHVEQVVIVEEHEEHHEDEESVLFLNDVAIDRKEVQRKKGSRITCSMYELKAQNSDARMETRCPAWL